MIQVYFRVVHGETVELSPPLKYATPYGGRLKWKLPGKNDLVVHLKDKTKIRHQKRWSQIMYMNFFLNYGIFDKNTDRTLAQTLADNTFVLTLDGDAEFEPSAVLKLLHRMKGKERLGAVCGRIHPTGKGPYVWYQKFEYAITHWLQKPTEHVLGSVLCTPGCFSLIRASSLMEESVMHTYSALPTSPREIIQFDQGEDRWLCTLILKQGYNVKYMSIADANSHCPENFQEFFNQRKRWVPSDYANSVDLLSNWRNVTRVNKNISNLYLAYQLLVLILSVIKPGTIFLLVVTALSSAFPMLDSWIWLLVVSVPLVIFMTSCYFMQLKYQIVLAKALTAVFSLQMVAAIVGLVVDVINDEGLCSPMTTIVIVLFIISFVLAVLHPKEFSCLVYAPLYLIAIPTGSLIMTIYCIVNMHTVSWGTRESPKIDIYNCTDEDNLFQETDVNGMNENKDTEMSLKRDHVANVRYGRDSSVYKEMFGEQASAMASARKCNGNSDMFTQTLPFWMKDSVLIKGKTMYLIGVEEAFWKDLIHKSLYPFEYSPEHQSEVDNGLRFLRNKICLLFLSANAFMVVLVITMQFITVIKEDLNRAIPISCDDASGPSQKIDPMSLLILILYGIAVFVQLVATIVHRIESFTYMKRTSGLKSFKTKKRQTIDEPGTVPKETRSQVQQIEKMSGSTADKVTTTRAPEQKQNISEYDTTKKRNKTKKSKKTKENSMPGRDLSIFLNEAKKERRKKRKPKKKHTDEQRDTKEAKKKEKGPVYLSGYEDNNLNKPDGAEEQLPEIDIYGQREGDKSKEAFSSWMHLISEDGAGGHRKNTPNSGDGISS